MNSAQDDIREIYKYISEDLQNPDAASQRISLVDETIQSLKEKPKRFALVRDDYLASKGFRMVVFKTHFVFFIVRDEAKTVSIMRVLYRRRDWMGILKIEAGQ